MKNSLSKGFERNGLKPYHKKPKTKLSKEICNIDNFSSSLSITKVKSRHSKSKSGNPLKHISDQMKPQTKSKPQYISPTHLSSSKKLTRKYVNSISSHQDSNNVRDTKYPNNSASYNQCHSMTSSSCSAMNIKLANNLMQKKPSTKLNFMNKTGGHNLMRRVNSSIGNISINKKNNISKSKKK